MVRASACGVHRGPIRKSPARASAPDRRRRDPEAEDEAGGQRTRARHFRRSHAAHVPKRSNSSAANPPPMIDATPFAEYITP